MVSIIVIVAGRSSGSGSSVGILSRKKLIWSSFVVATVVVIGCYGGSFVRTTAVVILFGFILAFLVVFLI